MTDHLQLNRNTVRVFNEQLHKTEVQYTFCNHEESIKNTVNFYKLINILSESQPSDF